MELLLLLGGGVLFYTMIRCYQYAKMRGYEQVVTLREGETFLGVLDRGKRDCLFIGDAPGRIYRNLTAEDVRLLKHELEPDDA
jgi:hypothetical protein